MTKTTATPNLLEKQEKNETNSQLKRNNPKSTAGTRNTKKSKDLLNNKSSRVQNNRPPTNSKEADKIDSNNLKPKNLTPQINYQSLNSNNKSEKRMLKIKN